MASRKLEVEFVGDTRSLEKAFGRASNAAGKSGNKVAAFGKAARTGVLAVGGAAALAGPRLVGLASDAQEVASKFKTVFGRETEQATKRLDAFSRASGTSKFALREQAAQFQALIRPMGLSTKGASEMSVGMTKLATDLASFNNSSVDEAMTALQSGLVGESEPLRRFGVQLSAARVEAFAYANGIAKSGKELTTAQKAQAAYGIIMKDTTLAQGDAVRTSGSFANQWKRLKSQATDLATELGTKLLPVVTKVVGAITGFIAGMKSGEGAGGRLVAVIRGIGSAIGDTIGWFQKNETVSLALAASIGVLAAGFLALKVQAGIASLIAGVTAAFAALNVTLAANPIYLVIAGLAALAAGFVVAYKKSETFRDIVDGAFKVVKAAVMKLWDAAKVVFPAIAKVVKGAWTVIKSVTSTVWNAIKGVLTTVWDAIKGVATTYFETYKSIVRTAWNVIKTVTEAAWKTVKTLIVNPVKGAVDFVKGALGNDGLIGWLGDRWEDVKEAAEKFAKPLKDAFQSVKNVADDVLSVIKDIVGFIKQIKLPKIDITPWSGLLPGGGKGNGTTVGPGTLLKPPSSVDGFNPLASMFGNQVTSGYRPGDDGWHGQNRARDYAGGDMLGFARYLLKNFAPVLLELIYTPLGLGVKNGQVVPVSFFGADVMADHYDHVHVAMAKGGIAPGGWALVGEEGPELARLPGGTRVYTAERSAQMMREAEPAGGAPTIVIQTLHPADPRTLRAVAQAANRGQTFMGGRRPARTQSNL